MKNTLVLLGILVGIAAPLSAHADPESFRTGDNNQSAKKARGVTAAHAQSARQIVYVTSKGVTGSHLPLVVARYHGHYDSMAPTAVYGRADLDRTGQLSVGDELIQRDPAISSAGGRR